MSTNIMWPRTIRLVSTGTMKLSARPSAARAGTAMAVGSMICVQVGLALTVPLFGQIGPLGAVWLRLAWAAVILLVAIRPRPWRFRRPILLATVVLGAVTAGVTILFMAAVARLPLGTATALEFLGPLGVAMARGRGGRRLLWPGLAAAGVLLLTHPWQGGASLPGIACALGAAVCWACYILLTQAVGDEVAGLRGLAVSIPVAALVATAVAGPAIAPALTPHMLLAGLGLALLLPVVPFSLEMCALRRLTAAAFGTLMCLEPAFALLAGFALLGQVPRPWALAGVAFVVAAGIGAERTGARPAPDESGTKTYVRFEPNGLGGCGQHREEPCEPTGRGADWTEEQGTIDEGRRCPGRRADTLPGPHKSYLQTLTREAGREVDIDALSKADASRLVDELQVVSGRGRPDLTGGNHKISVWSTAATTASRGPYSSAPLEWRPPSGVTTRRSVQQPGYNRLAKPTRERHSRAQPTHSRTVACRHTTPVNFKAR
jgi:inner membrane transporter RhtA